MNKPNFTNEQKDWICYQIGEWYSLMKPLLEGQHNLGYMKEKLKLMVCDDDIKHYIPSNAYDLLMRNCDD